ncbi:MAG: hypothetical protein RML35_13420 [Chloroherpetonaceae bacterium]|nr:hypothetical protein [Chloroherpetonaceae bacterium]
MMGTQGLSQRQVQTLRLSPQQILYTKLLQLPVLQLEHRIKQELEENPALEEGTESEEMTVLSAADEDIPPADPPTEVDPVELVMNGTDSSESSDAVLDPKAKDETAFESEIEEYLREQDDEGFKTAPLGTPDDESDSLQPVAEQNWREDLISQLHLLELSEREMLIAEEIIGNLDNDGYLRCPLQVIREGVLMLGVEVSEHEIEEVLAKIWELEPAGVGARNLQECLLIQLHALAGEFDDEREDDRLLAQKILTHHYADFTMMHYQKLMQNLGITQAQLRRAVQFIQKLNPKPIRGSSEAPRYIIPDFIVTIKGNEVMVTPNERQLPPLRISRRYRDLLESKSQS